MNKEEVKEITVREMSGISLYRYYKDKEKEKNETKAHSLRLETKAQDYDK